MKTSILTFDGITALDAIGPYEVLRSVPGWEVQFVAATAGEKRTDSGALGITADHALEDVTDTDVVLLHYSRNEIVSPFADLLVSLCSR